MVCADAQALLHHASEVMHTVPMAGSFLVAITPLLLNTLVGILLGGVIFGLVSLWQRFFHARLRLNRLLKHRLNHRLGNQLQPVFNRYIRFSLQLHVTTDVRGGDDVGLATHQRGEFFIPQCL